MPFKNKKQMRWAFATKQPWAKRWAKETNMKNLPEAQLGRNILRPLESSFMRYGFKDEKDQIKNSIVDGSRLNMYPALTNPLFPTIKDLDYDQFSYEPSPLDKEIDRNPNEYAWMNFNSTEPPVNPLPFKTYDISKQTGYNPQNALNQGKVPVTPKQDENAIPLTKKKSKFDPYFMLRGATTGLSWLANQAERNRQNAYRMSQTSLLGQRVPVNIDDYQPAYNNQYFQKGGLKEGDEIEVSSKELEQLRRLGYKFNII